MLKLVRVDNIYNETYICNNKDCFMYSDYKKIDNWAVDEVARLTRLREEGLSIREIAKNTGISKSTVYRKLL